jgi:hypothetical protein
VAFYTNLNFPRSDSVRNSCVIRLVFKRLYRSGAAEGVYEVGELHIRASLLILTQVSVFRAKSVSIRFSLEEQELIILRVRKLSRQMSPPV